MAGERDSMSRSEIYRTLKLERGALEGGHAQKENTGHLT